MIEYKIKKILVPVDFSPASINALDTAIALAKRHDATIVLLNVIETGVLADIPGDEYISGETVQAMTQNSELELQSLQKSIIERFLIPCEAIATTGFVSTSIIEISAIHEVDMIVMGTHGVFSFKELFNGSNAYNVVKNSDCPVLTIPVEKKWQSFKKILFPVRAIPSALEKYDFIRKIIRKNEASIKILGLATDYDKEVDLMKNLAMQMKEKLRDDEVRASTYFKIGKNMAEEVLKIASLIETDLIVITTTIDSSFKKLFFGHYTRHIINHARFPVLSIKPACAKA